MIVSCFSWRRVARRSLPRLAPITRWRSWRCPPQGTSAGLGCGNGTSARGL